MDPAIVCEIQLWAYSLRSYRYVVVVVVVVVRCSSWNVALSMYFFVGLVISTKVLSLMVSTIWIGFSWTICKFRNKLSPLNIVNTNPCSRVLPDKLTDSQLLKKFPSSYETQMFITAYTTARYLLPSWTRSIQSMVPHPVSRWSILMLSCHLRLGLQSGLFPSSQPTLPFTNFSFHHTCYISRPSNFFCLITRMIFFEVYRA